jgi:hypothetical protein
VTDTDRRTARTGALPLVRRAVEYEIGMWRSLYRWIFRRSPALETGAEAFGYTGVVTPIFGVFIGLSAIEIPILHLILPWQTAQRISLALGFYGLFWMVGLLASLRVHPHIVDDSSLRIRNGTSIDLRIPWDAVAAIRARYRSLPSGRSVQLEETESGHILHIAMAHQTSVDLTFREPTAIPLPKGNREPVTGVRFYVDDPKALVARARKHLTG